MARTSARDPAALDSVHQRVATRGGSGARSLRRPPHEPPSGQHVSLDLRSAPAAIDLDAVWESRRARVSRTKPQPVELGQAIQQAELKEVLNGRYVGDDLRQSRGLAAARPSSDGR
jgi:hypothetical protein